jgi:CBS domain-containing protein
MESQPDTEGVEDIMAKKVVTIDHEATVKDAASLMARRKCSCLVVLQGGAAVGIVTERDLVRKILAEGVDPSKVLISDVMTTPLVTIEVGSTITEAADRMSEYLIRRLVVVDSRGALVGLITAGDIARLLARKNEYSDSALNAIARMKKGETGGPYK